MSLLKIKKADGTWEGIQFLKGETGSDGITPNVTFSVETLGADQSMKITQTGSIESPVVKIGVPRGENANADYAVKKSGSRGVLGGFQTANVVSSNLVINQDSSDNTRLTNASDITVENGSANTSWTKTVTIANSDTTVTLAESWVWKSDNPPTITDNCVLVCHWCNDIGIATIV